MFKGVVAIVLLIGGGLCALQSMVISTGLPFKLILLMCFAILRGLQREPRQPPFFDWRNGAVRVNSALRHFCLWRLITDEFRPPA